jgi:predicted ATPase
MNLKINNFKCFEEQEVPFGQITVLAGANSVGKSSVVQALLLCRMVIEKFKGTESWLLLLEGKRMMFPPESFSLNGPFLLHLGNSAQVLNRNAYENKIKLSLSAQNTVFEVDLVVPDFEDSYNLILKDIRLSLPNNTQAVTLGHHSFYYLNAERIGPRIRHEVDDLPYLHTGWSGEYTVQMVGGNKILPIELDRCFDENSTKSLLEQSRLWLDYIAPGSKFFDPSLITGIKSAEIKFGDDRPTNVGFGLSYVLPIIVNGLIAEKGAMFIVENPEAHLHPLGQSRIGQFLAKIAAAGVQVVVETHSEHVINGIRIAALKDTISTNDVRINFFDRDENDKIKLIPILMNDAGDLTSYPKGFFDQEQRDMAEIIRQKRNKMGNKS